MYKEFRVCGSTPEMWSGNFLGPKSSIVGKIRYWLLRLHPCWREIAIRLTQGSRVLDAGCGLGQWVCFLNQNGIRACGLDFSPEIIAWVRQHHPTYEWLQGSIHSLPVAAGTLDGIISWGVIEHHEPGPQQALEEFHRALRPGGYIFVTVPCDTEAQRRTSVAVFDGPGPDKTFFQYFFTEQELAEVIRASGFVVEKTMPCSRHYALLFPRLYMRMTRAKPLVRSVVAASLGPYTWLRATSSNMILAIAKKV